MSEPFYYVGNGTQTHALLSYIYPGTPTERITLCGRPVNRDRPSVYEDINQPTCRKCRIMRGEDTYGKRLRRRE